MTYNTLMEEDAIAIIQKHYPNAEIVNPNIPEHQEGCWYSIEGERLPGKEIDYFLRLTQPCKIGCFLQYYPNKWSAGSASEANYMLDDKKIIKQVNLALGTLDPINGPVDTFTFEETMDKLVDAGIREYL